MTLIAIVRKTTKLIEGGHRCLQDYRHILCYYFYVFYVFTFFSKSKKVVTFYVFFAVFRTFFFEPWLEKPKFLKRTSTQRCIGCRSTNKRADVSLCQSVTSRWTWCFWSMTRPVSMTPSGRTYNASSRQLLTDSTSVAPRPVSVLSATPRRPASSTVSRHSSLAQPSAAPYSECDISAEVLTSN